MDEKVKHTRDPTIVCLSKKMNGWAEKEGNWVIPQFLRDSEVGWGTLQELLQRDSELMVQFEVMIANLHEKWLLFALDRKNSEYPKHIQQMFLRYLRVYDAFLFSLERGLPFYRPLPRETYVLQDFSKESLEGTCKTLYDANIENREKGAEGTKELEIKTAQ